MTYCALVGAISMARAVSDEELSREISKTANLSGRTRHEGANQ
jgi:hypothetical protein